MKRIITLLILLSIVPCCLCSCRRIITKTVTVGKHRIEIVDKSLSLHDSNDVFNRGLVEETHTYFSRSKHVAMKIEGEELTVNDKMYVIPNKDDSIKIVNGRVEINGRPAKPR